MTGSAVFEIAIIGAGPGGMGAAANAAHHKINHVLIERAEVGNTVYDYQLGKHVMAEPSRLPLRSQVPFDAGKRETILEGWNAALKKLGVNMLKGDVKTIAREANGEFAIGLADGSTVRAKKVVLAIGLQGAIRKLEQPGHHYPHVNYTLRDPAAINDQDVLVIGAGDAGIENAMGLVGRNRVAVLNRVADFARAKNANATMILKAIGKGEVTCYYDSELIEVKPDSVIIEGREGRIEVRCTHIIARIGAIPPRKFLEACGIKFAGPGPESLPAVNEKYESSVPGLHIVGALIGYPLIKQAMNQGFEVVEHILGNPVEPADEAMVREALKLIPGSVFEKLAFLRKNAPILEPIPEPQLREIAVESQLHDLKTGDVVFEHNAYEDSVYFVLKGAAEVILPNERPRLPVGTFFGEMGLLSGRRRSATVKAAEPTWLIEIPRKQMLKMISMFAEIKQSVDKVFTRNVLSSQIFKGIAADILNELIDRAPVMTLKKGQSLFVEGEPADAMYVVRKGSVKVSKRDAHGEDIAVTYVPAGHVVGEMAILTATETNRSATITAAVPCEFLKISKEDFQRVLNSSPTARAQFERLVTERKAENLSKRKDTKASEILDFMVAEGVTDAENVLIIDSDLCVGCDNCEAACAATHGGYSRLDRKGGKSFASIQIPISCRHCENPLCMLDCPPDALTRLPDGEVVIRDNCIGCGNCQSNCPYGVIQMVYRKPDPNPFSLWDMLFGPKVEVEDPKKDKGAAMAGKCDMCRTLEGGPSCVRSCPTGAAMRVHPSELLELLEAKHGGG